MLLYYLFTLDLGEKSMGRRRTEQPSPRHCTLKLSNSAMARIAAVLETNAVRSPGFRRRRRGWRRSRAHLRDCDELQNCVGQNASARAQLYWTLGWASASQPLLDWTDRSLVRSNPYPLPPPAALRRSGQRRWCRPLAASPPW